MSAAFCPACGTARPADAAFCPNCAHRFAEAAVPPAEPAAPPPVDPPPAAPSADPEATVRVDAEPVVPAEPAGAADPDATMRIDPDATVRIPPEAAAPPEASTPEAAAPRAASSAVPPVAPVPPMAPIPPIAPLAEPVPAAPPASGGETIFVPPESLPPPVKPMSPAEPVAPLGAAPTPPMTREERRALRRQRRAQGTPRETTKPIAPLAPAAPAAPASPTPIEFSPSSGWDEPGMSRQRLPKAARIGLFSLAGVVGLVALLALALVLGTGTIEANAAPWLRQQAATVPGQMAYDDIEAHPIRGVMTLTNVRYSERGAAAVGDSDLTAERVDIDVPRAFFFAALAGRLPELQQGAPVEEIDMTARDVIAYEFNDEVAMRAEEVSVRFDGLFAPEVYETGFDVATNQSGRIVLRGVSAPEASRDVPDGVPSTIDEMVFDARWDAGSGEFEIREARFEAGDIDASGDGQLTVAPTILSRLKAGDFDGAESLIDSGVVPFTSLSYDAQMASGAPISIPLADEGTFEIGSFSMSADAGGTFGGENATWQTADLNTSGTWKANMDGMRVVLVPEAASRFDARQGAELGITAAMLAEPMSVNAEIRMDGNRLSIRRAEGESGLGRVKASGVLELDPRDPEAAFFAEPFELRLDQLPASFSSQLSSIFNQSTFPGFQRDGDAFVIRLEGALRDLARQF